MFLIIFLGSFVIVGFCLFRSDKIDTVSSLIQIRWLYIDFSKRANAFG